MREKISRRLIAVVVLAVGLCLAASTQIDLTNQVRGTLPHGNGGTDVTSPGSAGNVLRSNGSSWASAALGFSDLSGTGSVTTTIASGTSAMGTSAISSSTCASVVTTSATGTATTDTIIVDFNADPTSTTGYQAGAMLTIVKYPTTNNVNFKVCNNTGSSITPGAATLNWRVVR